VCAFLGKIDAFGVSEGEIFGAAANNKTLRTMVFKVNWRAGHSRDKQAHRRRKFFEICAAWCLEPFISNFSGLFSGVEVA